MSMLLKRCLLALCVLIISACQPQRAEALQPAPDNASLIQAFEHKQSHVQVTGNGVVVKLLPDDNRGARHQRFLLRVNAQQVLLFAHNIDLAPKVPLQAGDTISFSGEYIYNPKGGVLHWTHHAPRPDHASGWIMLNGKKYQ